MLSEHFIAAIGPAKKSTSTAATKDAAIFQYEFQPVAAQRTVFKKGNTPSRCLAVSKTHVFAAQADKGVVHVYSRESGSQEALVPFNERITSLTLACDDSVLALGTSEGRIFLWELASGRQLSTAHSHLKAVTQLAIDPTGNFLLSGSTDSTIHVWSVPAVLSFTSTQLQPPVQTFTGHRTEITSLAVGHSSSFCNFAISTSKDRTCFLWDYNADCVLRTFLLPLVPLCICLDPADRYAYVGYEDGSLQRLDMYASPSSSAPQAPQNDRNMSQAPIQPGAQSRWTLPDPNDGPARSISVSFDSYTVLSGHESGAINAWDAATQRFQSIVTQPTLPGPINNLQFLPVQGFSSPDILPTIRIPSIVKPKFGAFDTSGDGSVPMNYSLNIEFTQPLDSPSAFENALSSQAFPSELLEQGLAELKSWSRTPARTDTNDIRTEDSSDFMALDVEPADEGSALKHQNEVLKAQLEALRRVQRVSFERMEKLDAERRALLQREQSRRVNRDVNGADTSDDDGDG